MTYKEIETYFINEVELEKLLQLYISYFNQVEIDADRLTKHDSDIAHELENILSRQTGIFMKLNIVAEISDTYQTKQEGIKNFQIVKELNEKEGKVVQAQIDKQVSHEVQFIRRVRNIFRAYRDSASTCIVSCQSRLKRYTPSDMNNNKSLADKVIENLSGSATKEIKNQVKDVSWSE